MNKNDKIIVTGARGLFGSALVECLRQRGYSNIVGVGREECDLTDIHATRRYFSEQKPDYVFHAAGRVYGIMGNMNNKALSFYDNILINTSVVDAAHRAGVSKIAVMGTGAVYPYPPPALPFTEDMIFLGEPHKSEDSYSHAKRAMLGMLRAYSESHGLKWTYIVSCNLYGPRDRFDPEQGHVVPSLVNRFHKAKLSGERVSVWGDGTAQRDFLYVEDAAAAAILAMDHVEGPVNIGSGSVYTIRELVDTLAQVSGMEGRVDWDKSKPNGREYLGYDLSKIDAAGFKPQNTLKEGLQKTWEWYAQHVGGGNE
ncbi:GDP-L-fucose synthase family protein [Xanthomonas sacchari]|uniref:GDP-L-fucose synthase family protein n=1 Tax=Xanthomonas sacchari TaxID=56458 RepID=UPI0022572C8A|nr:GDP-L-fucose synthase [Xanthomonas sacchari]